MPKKIILDSLLKNFKNSEFEKFDEKRNLKSSSETLMLGLSIGPLIKI